MPWTYKQHCASFAVAAAGKALMAFHRLSFSSCLCYTASHLFCLSPPAISLLFTMPAYLQPCYHHLPPSHHTAPACLAGSPGAHCWHSSAAFCLGREESAYTVCGSCGARTPRCHARITALCRARRYLYHSPTISAIYRDSTADFLPTFIL